MIYTIGHKELYENSRDLYETIQKPGKSCIEGQEYPGGIAFLTQDEAQERLDLNHPDSGYAVYGLDANWETDTYAGAFGQHYLLNTATILFL